jgi:hypothetical protein
MMVHVTCQLNQAIGCPDSWLLFLDKVKVFPEEISTGIGGLSKAHVPSPVWVDIIQYVEDWHFNLSSTAILRYHRLDKL